MAWLQSHSTRAFDTTVKPGSLGKKQIFWWHLQPEMAQLAWSRLRGSEAKFLRGLVANVQYITVKGRLHVPTVTPGCATWRTQRMQGASCRCSQTRYSRLKLSDSACGSCQACHKVSAYLSRTDLRARSPPIGSHSRLSGTSAIFSRIELAASILNGCRAGFGLKL